MLGITLMLLGMFLGTKATTSSLAGLIGYIDEELNRKGAFTCELCLMGVKLQLNDKRHRKVAQIFFDTCRLGKSVEQVPTIRFLRIYLFTNCILHGNAVDALPSGYLDAYPEFKKQFIEETKRIWELNPQTLLPFVEILKLNNCSGFILPSEAELFSTK